MIIYKNTLICDKVHKSKKTELIAVKVETYQKPVVLCAAYRPPRSDLYYLQHMETTLKPFQYTLAPLWFGGDFNLPDVDWNMNLITGHQYPKILNKAFLDMINRLE